MSRTGFSTSGPKCFGLSKRTSFVDIRDDDIPGPGTHNSSRIDKKTPNKWKFGKSTQRDSFLEKHPRPNPAPTDYNANPEPLHESHPQYSFPKNTLADPAGFKNDDNCTLNYQPKTDFNKAIAPKFSFGYSQQRDYGTPVPAPNSYRLEKPLKDREHFNKTQSFFTRSHRPNPYGEQGQFPGSTKYQIKDQMRATSYSFTSSPRRLSDARVEGVIPVKFYDIAQNLKQPGKGWTMRPYYEQIKNKDQASFPAPNQYNPKSMESKRNIINLNSQRSNLYGKDQVAYPSPQKHVTSADFYKKRQSLSFTKQTREKTIDNENPGPGNYEVEAKLSKQKGYMGRKLKQVTPFITPASSDYKPNNQFVQPTSQRTISYKTDRVDFSKSITGAIGPGHYKNDKQSRQQLGKMSKSLKFDPNRNKNPGPGFYEIPTSIGKLPKYYNGPKKVTTTGFSTFALELTQRTRRREQLIKQRQQQTRRREQVQLEQQQLREQRQQRQQRQQMVQGTNQV